MIFPSEWPLVWRRAFLLTLPISGPIYLAVTVGGALAALIAFSIVAIGAVVLVPPAALMWFGAVRAVDWCDEMWSRPR